MSRGSHQPRCARKRLPIWFGAAKRVVNRTVASTLRRTGRKHNSRLEDRRQKKVEYLTRPPAGSADKFDQTVVPRFRRDRLGAPGSRVRFSSWGTTAFSGKAPNRMICQDALTRFSRSPVAISPRMDRKYLQNVANGRLPSLSVLKNTSRRSSRRGMGLPTGDILSMCPLRRVSHTVVECMLAASIWFVSARKTRCGKYLAADDGSRWVAAHRIRRHRQQDQGV